MSPDWLLEFFGALFIVLAFLLGRLTGYNAGYAQADADHDLMLTLRRELAAIPPPAHEETDR